MRGGTDTQDEPRAGARLLELLANPLNARILRALADGPLRISELHDRAAWPAQTTLRAAIGTLRDLGLVERVEVSRMPLGVANQLTGAGQEALFVVDEVERWLAKGPQGSIPIDSDAAKASLKALSSAWSSTMVRTLAGEPASLTELDRRIPDLSYPSLERRLSRMKATRQVEPSTAEGRGQPFEVTDWLRHSVAPLAAAARCERRHMKEDTAPITAVEIEAAFLLAVPIAPLPETAEGVCALTVPAEDESPSNSGRSLAGAIVEVRAGQLIRCEPDLNSGGPTWALGAPATWMDAVIEGHLDALRFGGTSPQLAVDLVHGLHVGLFGESS